MSDQLTSDRRSWNMSQIKGKNTKPEIIVRKFLHASGYRFRIHQKNLLGKPDIVLSKYKTVVFVHGCFWHRHENCKYSSFPKTNIEFWREKFKRNVERDNQIISDLERLGWNVIIIWECEVKSLSFQKILIDRLQSLTF